ncbi:glycosyltransferase family 1 protein [Nocardiopsis gilva YIM 90087]|uniref:Glycosyltransferase family 1 protein n=1 Tax=Nocardiopsis gilva YIM 90087 TaxID=1235441 RepID=A0A223SBH5_9ACTN|nr:glycosyltransferase family 4 protein [Nocardiopsis gilva]ASU85436.1 glycosyltransferase family 1 protein [Nocardiopsis gilva YIM 90087]
MVYQQTPLFLDPIYGPPVTLDPEAPETSGTGRVRPAGVPFPSAATGGPETEPARTERPGEPDAPTEPRLDGVRIVMINWRDPWQSVAGGAEEYAWRMSRHLAGRGACVTFLTSREPGQARVETRQGIVIRRMGQKFSVYPLVMLWLLLWRREFHIALDCMNGIPFFSRLLLPRRTRVISVVHHVHDLQFNAYFNRPLAWFGRFIESTVASRVYRSCMTVTVSESSRRAMREKLRWRSPITVIHNGSPPVQPIALDHARAARRARSGEASPTGTANDDMGSPAIVSLGRLVVQKRVSRVVDIASRLRDSRPGLRVHIVGRGPETEPLAERIENEKLHDHVRLHGFLPEADKNAVLARSVLHVTASEFEGWGLTVIEAAGLGVPTVAYDVDGLRDSVRHGETGWLVREGEDLTEVVDKALAELSDPARAAEISAACRTWAARFTWEKSGANMTRLIASTLGRADADATTSAPTAAAGTTSLPAPASTATTTSPADEAAT